MATLSEFDVKVLLGAGARTASANGTGVDLQPLTHPGGRNMKAFLDVAAASGTSPTLDVKMQESDDNSSFSDIAGATFTQATAAGQQQIHFHTTKRYVRAVAAIGGTTPSFTCGCYLVGQKRNA
jgi:hypothetical protein